MSSVSKSVSSTIKELVRSSIQACMEDGSLNIDGIPEVYLEVPGQKEHGDFATNTAMVLAKPARKAPRAIAELILSHLPSTPYIDKVEIAGPGFINFHLGHLWLEDVLREIVGKGDEYGRSDIGGAQKLMVEYVSANPTGPMHVGHGRGAAVGSALASILGAAGFDVTKEFYVNDAGNQFQNFAKSLEARYLQALGREVPFPEDGYHGKDLIELMGEYVRVNGDVLASMDSVERRKVLAAHGLKVKLEDIERDLAAFGVTFDVWTSEQAMHDSGAVGTAIKFLVDAGMTYEKDGALWFKSSEAGDDKDRVLIRENGITTYLSPDIAYHKDKYDRGFEKLINVWGADHHGYIPRMKAAVGALGHDPDSLEVVIIQMVTLLKGGQPVTMSKRSGEYVTLSEVVEEVGKDAARFFFLMRSPDSHLDFDLDLAVSQSAENPVYYVQYAHARISSILRQAADEGVVPEGVGVDLSLLKEAAEIDLIKKLARYTEEIERAALDRSPQRLTKYATDLAAEFHSFYNVCRVICQPQELMAARFYLVGCVRQVLMNVLSVLGISAPERM